MKRIIIYMVLVLMILGGCHKEGFEKVADYSGDFHLTYIKVSELQYMTPDEIENEVGVRVLENGDIETFIDGKFHRKYKIQGAGIGSNDTVRSVYQWENNRAITIKLFEGNKILIEVFPFEGELNYFEKD